MAIAQNSTLPTPMTPTTQNAGTTTPVVLVELSEVQLEDPSQELSFSSLSSVSATEGDNRLPFKNR